MYIAYKSFCHFLQHNCSSELETIDDSQIDYSSWCRIDATSGKRPVCLDANVTVAGHSFGGCIMLHILSTNTPSEYPHISITHALIPWLEPLPLPGPIPLLRTPSSLPDNSASPSLPNGTTRRNETQDHEPQDSCLPQMMLLEHGSHREGGY